jgi:hypothetical protein
MTLPRLHQSNIHWYPYADLGSYFRLEDGLLFQRPMLRDGSLSEDGETEVDWSRGASEGDLPKLHNIVEELKHKA